MLLGCHQNACSKGNLEDHFSRYVISTIGVVYQSKIGSTKLIKTRKKNYIGNETPLHQLRKRRHTGPKYRSVIWLAHVANRTLTNLKFTPMASVRSFSRWASFLS